MTPTATPTSSPTPTLAPPTFSPRGGTYENSVTVALSHADPLVEIRYSVGWTTDAVYTAPLTFNGATAELKAYTRRSGFAPSAVVTETYNVVVGTPTFTPDAGTYAIGQELVVSVSTPGATIRYTTNGLDPTREDPVMPSSLRLQGNVTLKARAFKVGLGDSAVKTAAYIITGQAAAGGRIAGGGHVLAVRPDGTAWSWGDPYYTQLVPTLVPDLAAAQEVAAGARHSIVLKDASVWTWGNNDYGQLGQGATGAVASPTMVAGLSGVEMVAAGDDHTIAVAGGLVYTWGRNDQGQLGNGDSLLKNQDRPVSIGAGGIRAVAAGRAHTLAIRDADGAVLAWGDNDYGQLSGTGDQNVPVLVTGLPGPARAIAAGILHSLALLENGEVWIWGAKSGTFDWVPVRTPQRLGGLDGVLSIAGWGTRSVASRVDGTLWMCEANWIPVRVDASNVSRVAAGNAQAFAITADGAVFGWGERIGDGTSSAYSAPRKIAEPVFDWMVGTPVLNPAPATYSVNTQPVDLSTATVGATVHYTLDGSEPTDLSPGFAGRGTVTLTDSTLLRARAFKAGMPASHPVSGDYVLKVKPPTFAPPAGTYGGPVDVIVNSATNGAEIHCTTNGLEPTLQDPRCDSGAVRIAASTTLKAKAWLTGRPTSDTTYATYMIQAPPPPAPVMNPAPGTYTRLTRLTLSTTVANAVIRFTTDGSEPTAASRVYRRAFVLDAPTTVKAKVFAADGPPSVTATGTYSVTLGPVAAATFSVDGGVYATERRVTITSATTGAVVRYTTDGREPAETDAVADPLVPVRVDRGMRLKAKAWKDGVASHTRAANYWITGAIAGGPSVTLALKADGSVWERRGVVFELLCGGTGSQPLTVVGGLSAIVAVDVGFRHCLALKADGSVWAWGDNQNFQLGVETPSQRTTPEPVPGLSGIIAIAAGIEHNLALDAAGRVWAWGQNEQQQLGISGVSRSAAPVEVPLLGGVSAIAAARTASAAVKSDGAEAGTVWAWGERRGATPSFTGLVGIKTIELGAYSADDIVALTSQGTVHPWGDPADGRWSVHDIVSLATVRHAIGADGAVWDMTERVLAGAVEFGGTRDFAVLLDVAGAFRDLTWDYTNWRYTIGPPLLELAQNSALLDDADGDGLPTWRELREGTDPYDFDTNDDGISDGAQLNLQADANTPDADGDGVSNAVELERGTDPFSSDTDRDGVADDIDCFPLDAARTACPPPDPTDVTPPRVTLSAPRVSPVSVVPAE